MRMNGFKILMYLLSMVHILRREIYVEWNAEDIPSRNTQLKLSSFYILRHNPQLAPMISCKA